MRGSKMIEKPSFKGDVNDDSCLMPDESIVYNDETPIMDKENILDI